MLPRKRVLNFQALLDEARNPVRNLEEKKSFVLPEKHKRYEEFHMEGLRASRQCAFGRSLASGFATYQAGDYQKFGDSYRSSELSWDFGQKG